MSVGNIIKSIQDIMRQDTGVDGDAQRISQLVWMIFLKIFDDKEQEYELLDEKYVSPIPERLRWLGEALPVMRGMLRGEAPTAAGVRYHAQEVRNDPPPIQARLPLLIGGGGEQVTLKLVARYADANNVGGGIETVKRKEEILLRHCEAVGRDPAEIERTTGVGTVVIRDSEAEARKVFEATFAANGDARPWQDQPVGTRTIGRGYDPASASGDRGIAGAFEARLGPFGVTDQFSVQPYGFYDVAQVTNRDALGAGSTSLASVGGGAQIRWRNGVLLDLVYAQGLDSIRTGQGRPSGRLLVNLTVAVK